MCDFLNIWLSEAIDIAINIIIRTATFEIHFIFNGSIFDQINGVAMGVGCSMQSCFLFMKTHKQIG